MATSKTFIFIIIATALTALFLGGCAATPSETGYEMAAPPAPENQNFEQVQQPQTEPSIQAEDDIISPPQVSLEEPVLDSDE
ncbi:MAG: hypothetical protein ABFR35_06430, partial [Thermodesulfobacteriota bacterium]